MPHAEEVGSIIRAIQQGDFGEAVSVSEKAAYETDCDLCHDLLIQAKAISGMAGEICQVSQTACDDAVDVAVGLLSEIQGIFQEAEAVDNKLPEGYALGQVEGIVL